MFTKIVFFEFLNAFFGYFRKGLTMLKAKSIFGDRIEVYGTK